jgi:cell division protein FtsL
MWRTAAVCVFLVGVLLFWAWQQFELLRHGYRLEQMQRDRAAETEINRHLRLEIDTLRSPARIERLATDRLQMVPPGPDDASVIERVTTPPAPPRSAVARR